MTPKTGAHDDDGGFNIEFGPGGLFHDFGKSGEKVADDQTDDQGDNKSAFPRELQGPADADTLELRRGIGGDIGKMAQEPAADS